jgi:transposase-like protein
MSLHFLLKAEARTLSVVQVLAMGDDDALALFRHLRWGEGEEVVCPHCGMAHRHYFRPTRKIWRCAGCQDDFSVTSGTIFAFHKLPLRLYLAAAILFTNAVKGLSALQMGRDLGVSHKTAYVLLHKIRESLLVGRDESALQGKIHVDGAYVGGTVRPENKKEGRVDRRLAENQDPDKRCILVMREAYTETEVEAGNAGARKTLTFIVKNENQADLGKLAPVYIAQGAVICADESDAYRQWARNRRQSVRPPLPGRCAAISAGCAVRVCSGRASWVAAGFHPLSHLIEEEPELSISTDTQAQILRYYHAERWRIGTIATQLGVHHGTVRRVLTQAGLPRTSIAPRPSRIDPYLPFIRETLAQFPTLTARRLYVMVQERGYPGGPDHFRHLVALHRPRPKAEAYLRLRTLPGEQAQVDWGTSATWKSAAPAGP